MRIKCRHERAKSLLTGREIVILESTTRDDEWDVEVGREYVPLALMIVNGLPFAYFEPVPNTPIGLARTVEPWSMPEYAPLALFEIFHPRLSCHWDIGLHEAEFDRGIIVISWPSWAREEGAYYVKLIDENEETVRDFCKFRSLVYSEAGFFP